MRIVIARCDVKHFEINLSLFLSTLSPTWPKKSGQKFEKGLLLKKIKQKFFGKWKSDFRASSRDIFLLTAFDVFKINPSRYFLF